MGIFTDEELEAFIISDTLGLLVQCAKPATLDALRELNNADLNACIRETEPSFILTDENIETLSTLKLEDLDIFMEPSKEEEGRSLLELVNTYVDNASSYIPYEEPKSSRDFNSLISRLTEYGKDEEERVALMLAFKLQAMRNLFVDKPNSRKKGTKYKSIYQNIKVIEMVKRSLTLILSTKDRRRWLTF